MFANDSLNMGISSELQSTLDHKGFSHSIRACRIEHQLIYNTSFKDFDSANFFPQHKLIIACVCVCLCASVLGCQRQVDKSVEKRVVFVDVFQEAKMCVSILGLSLHVLKC